jgi:molybdopterin-guanine dinucleotide biosynthesis protein A
MGEQDKGWVEFRGRPLVHWVLERFVPQVAEVLVSANRNLDRYAALNVRVVPDLLPDYRGPLAGLQAAFRSTAAELLASVPCDAPFLPADLVERLGQGLIAARAQVAVAACAGRLYPVFCLCRRSALAGLEAYLARGERRVEGWCRSQPLAQVEFDDPDAFRNLNRPEDLAGS